MFVALTATPMTMRARRSALVLRSSVKGGAHAVEAMICVTRVAIAGRESVAGMGGHTGTVAWQGATRR